MNRILNETMSDKKADAAFEQRMVSRFRDRVPKRSGLISLVTDLLRVRAVQLTAAAALLLSMVQMGRWLTAGPTMYGNEELAVRAVTDPNSLDELRTKLAQTEVRTEPPAMSEVESYGDKP